MDSNFRFRDAFSHTSGRRIGTQVGGFWTRRQNRFATDSPLEGRVRSEPVSEAGFSGAGELRPDSKMFMDDAARRNGGYFGGS